MLRLIYGYNLLHEPDLAKNMFRDRAFQGADRLAWDVKADKNGIERDFYDTLNPLYLIETGAFGEHLGSLRLLPTMGRTMFNDNSGKLFSGAEIQSPHIWECTRFCLARHAEPRTTSRLLVASGRLMRELCLDELVGVLDERMSKVFHRSGVISETLGEGLYAGEHVAVGRWRYTDKAYKNLLSEAGIDVVEMELYFANSGLPDLPRLHA